MGRGGSEPKGSKLSWVLSMGLRVLVKRQGMFKFRDKRSDYNRIFTL